MLEWSGHHSSIKTNHCGPLIKVDYIENRNKLTQNVVPAIQTSYSRKVNIRLKRIILKPWQLRSGKECEEIKISRQ